MSCELTGCVFWQLLVLNVCKRSLGIQGGTGKTKKMYEIDQFTPAFIACLSSVKCLQRMNKENAHSTELSVTTILISTWCNTWPWLISSLNLPVDDYLRESICAPYTLSSCSYPNNSSPTKTHPSHPIMRILPGSPQKHRSQSGNYHQTNHHFQGKKSMSRLVTCWLVVELPFLDSLTPWPTNDRS